MVTNTIKGLTVEQAADLMVVEYDVMLRRQTWTLVAALAIMNGYNPEAPPELLLRVADNRQREMHKGDLARMRQHLLDDFNTKGMAYAEALQIRRPPDQWIAWAIENGYEEIPHALVQYTDQLSKPVDGKAQQAGQTASGAPSSQISKLETRIEWLKQRLHEKQVELPLPLHRGGQPGIKAEMRAEALQHSRLFTHSTFDHAWKALPKTDA